MVRRSSRLRIDSLAFVELLSCASLDPSLQSGGEMGYPVCALCGSSCTDASKRVPVDSCFSSRGLPPRAFLGKFLEPALLELYTTHGVFKSGTCLHRRGTVNGAPARCYEAVQHVWNSMSQLETVGARRARARTGLPEPPPPPRSRASGDGELAALAATAGPMPRLGSLLAAQNSPLRKG